MKINNKIEEGRQKVVEFVNSLIERNKVPMDQREAEQKRLEEMITKRVFDEILDALPDDSLEELDEATTNDGDFPLDKWNSVLFTEGISPKSIVGKVFREVEREYLGAENVETEEALIREVEEGE